MANNRENKKKQYKSVENEFDSEFPKFSKSVIDDINKNIDNPKLRQRIYKLFEAKKYKELIETIIKNNVLDAVKLGYGGEIQFLNDDQLTKKMLTRSWVDDGINASKRINRATNKVKKAVADDITAIIREGDSNKKITKSIKKRIDAGDLDSDAIRSDITKLSRKTKDKKTLLEVKRIRRELSKGPSTKLKRSYERFLKAYESGDEIRIQKAIDNAIDKKARYVAERISRSEVNRAWTEGFHLKHKDDEDVIGYKWKLSNGHREIFDQCDVYANSDFGMGKGVFKKGLIPTQPAHPNCRCYLIPVYEGDADPKDFNLKNADKRIKNLDEKQKFMLMGDKNRKLFNSGKISYQKAIRGFEKPKAIKTRIVESEIK